MCDMDECVCTYEYKFVHSGVCVCECVVAEGGGGGGGVLLLLSQSESGGCCLLKAQEGV